MSRRYSIKMYSPDGDDYGAVQATKGQIVNLFQWLDSWSGHSERRGLKRGLLYGGGVATLVYAAWVWFEWAVL